MRLVRTAAGGFLNVEKIERLVDERGDVAASWIAICADGEEIPLAPYYSAPGRAERELQGLVAGTAQLPTDRLRVAGIARIAGRTIGGPRAICDRKPRCQPLPGP